MGGESWLNNPAGANIVRAHGGYGACSADGSDGTCGGGDGQVYDGIGTVKCMGGQGADGRTTTATGKVPVVVARRT